MTICFEKGNTQIVAEIISEHTGGKLFHIETATAQKSKDRTNQVVTDWLDGLFMK